MEDCNLVKKDKTMDSENDDATRTPLLLMPLAEADQDAQTINDAHYEELRAVVGDREAADIGPSNRDWIIEALDQKAPDGWYFGLHDGSYGCWPSPDA